MPPDYSDPIHVARFASDREIAAISYDKMFSLIMKLSVDSRLTDAEFRRFVRVWSEPKGTLVCCAHQSQETNLDGVTFCSDCGRVLGAINR